MEGNTDKHAPCLDKSCSFCCNPVKISQRAIVKGFKPPLDKDGNNLWDKRDEILIPKDGPETERVVTFDCKNYDAVSGRCLDYDNRPDICRGTTCIRDEAGNIDEQHKKLTEVTFIKLR